MSRVYGDVGKHFNNKISTLEKMLDKEVREELINVGEETVNKLKQFLDKYWYDTYSPTDYKRTYSLRNSIRYTIKKNKVLVYFDRRYFSTKTYNDGNGWQPHRGFDDNIFIKGLIDFLDDGTGGGGISTNPRKFDGNLDIIGYSEKIINQYLETLVNKKIKIIMKKYL